MWRGAKAGSSQPTASYTNTNVNHEGRFHSLKERFPGQGFRQEGHSFTYGQSKVKSSFSTFNRTTQDSYSLSSSCSNTVETVERPCVRTSTQLSEEEGDKCDDDTGKLDTPLSPLQITLSQICAMEESQVMIGGEEEEGEREENGEGEMTVQLTCENGEERETMVQLTCDTSTTKCSTAAVEDSGYMSREVSAVKSPSPLGQEGVDQQPSDFKVVEQGGSKRTAVVELYCDSGNEDELLADVTLEGLNDSLEDIGEDASDGKVIGSHWSGSEVESKEQTSNIHSRSPAPATARKVGGGVVKPRMGSLLSARLNKTRIRLQDAVRYRPPGGFSLSQLHSLGVSDATTLVRASNAVDFCFSGAQYFSSAVLNGSPVYIGDGAMLRLSRNGKAGVSEFWEAFRTLPSVDEKLISYEWFVNHYRQVVWKLASMEVSYPHIYGGRGLTPDSLMLQLKYRYDREIDQAERSALHKICENDDVPSRRMVVCVSRIYEDRLKAGLINAGGKGAVTAGTADVESGNETVIQSHETGKDSTPVVNPPSIEVTDGWYSLPCVLDDPLKQMVKRGRVKVGTKLLVYGAELIGQSNPSHPLEVPASCALKFSANSTRRARWFAKLGYHPVPHPFPSPLMSVFPEGGLVGCTEVVIARVYPLAYLEKIEGKKSILRSERLEQKIAALHEAERQRKIDSICAKVQKKFEDDVAKQGMEFCTKGMCILAF